MKGRVAFNQGIVLLAFLASSSLFAQGQIPPECYLDQQNNSFNSCKYCHTSGQPGAGNHDVDRQGAFPAQENKFVNVLDPARLDELVPPETIPADLIGFLDLDNYRTALEARGGAAEIGSGRGVLKYFPNLDPEQTGADGFANNGWRAFKWKPFELAWPRYNGRIQQNWVRLPDKFQRRADGEEDLEIYKQNLDLMVEVARGRVTEGAYLGMAADEKIIPYRFPGGVEVLHYLYYLDPSRPDMRAKRIKEVRWNIKTVPTEKEMAIFGFVSRQEKELSLAHREGGEEAAALYGLVYNKDGWDIIGFIEDVDGSLRPQNAVEMKQCIGCHSRRTGVPIDSHFLSLQRKLPGEAGWTLQDYRNIYDYHNAGLQRGEMGEIFANYFGDASLLPGNPDGTINFMPTPEEAKALTRRYYQIVQTQSFALGRDPKLVTPGLLQDPATARFRPKEEQETWHSPLDFGAFDLASAVTAVVEERSVIPLLLRLYPNYPNPFNAATAIRYSLSEAGRVTLVIYNLNGQLVRFLVDGPQQAGTHLARWNGRDQQGNGVATGLYICQLTHGQRTLNRKMLLTR